MKTAKPLRFETLAVHAGHGVDPATGAVVDPIHLSTTFERAADGSYPHGYIYSRNHNPNRNGLEAALAALEGGAAAAAFGSGLAAVTAIFQGLQPGDHVVAPRDIYHGTANVLKHLFAKWQVGATFVDMTRARRRRRGAAGDDADRLDRDAVEPADPVRRHRRRRRHRASRRRARASPTTPSPRRRCSARSSSAATW